ncbi:uncharacterized protein OCT59_002289 [Rhizophagus irregularis]|uniref:uncharacterized protein n=1 Tax=Rhizophagus irregularis TaxID=588596 RepID=UPI0033182C64|nr:hypothetical protein OCT59_002289 [Rhizophagus irregularis]
MKQLRPFKKDIRQIWRIYGKTSRNYWLERYARLIDFLPIEISIILKKTRSSCKSNKKTQKFTDIASNIISVTDSDYEEVEENEDDV